jgi:Protein of unknown function (DUF3489)
MPKPAKKRASPLLTTPVPPAKTAQSMASASNTNKDPDTGSKQSRVIAMLQSPGGVTIAAMMKATGWQQHSVRGFLAGVVRKRLKFKLDSKKADGNRIYKIVGVKSSKPGTRRAKRSSP